MCLLFVTLVQMRLSSNPLESKASEKVCFRSNINRAGKARRTKIAALVLALGVASLVASRVFGLSFLVTAAVTSLCFAGSLFTFLEVTRQTCVVLANKVVTFFCVV